MQIMRPTTDTAPTSTVDADELRLVVESDEDEELVFVAATEDELEAKLDDFLVWAS